MKRPYVIASLVIAADVVLTAAFLHAPGLALLAVPSIVGLAVARRHPRAGAIVIAVAALPLLAIALAQWSTGPAGIDLAFDLVMTPAGTVALADGIRTAVGGNRVTGLAGR